MMTTTSHGIDASNRSWTIQDLWDVTNGSEVGPKPVDPKAITAVERTAIDKWRNKDKEAKKEICLRVSDEYLVYIDQTTTAPELQAGLQAIFQSKVAIGMVNLHRAFFRTFAEDGANMEKHVQKLQGIYLQLNARGQLMSDGDLSNMLLTSLTPGPCLSLQ